MLAKGVFVCLALVIGIGFPALVSATPAAQAASSSLTPAMLAIINQDRQAAGVAPLHIGRRLAQVALAHSLDMADDGYFSHDTPEGASPFDRMQRAGIHYHWAGENIGEDSGASEIQMLQRLETLMLNSPEHRANLLRPTYTRVGIGIAILGNELFLTEDFKY